MRNSLETPAITAIKGFKPGLICAPNGKPFQFAEGQTYTATGAIKACKNGFHACPVDDDTPPHAVFEYYAPGTSVFREVTLTGKTNRDGNKIAGASITIGVELTMGEIMRGLEQRLPWRGLEQRHRWRGLEQRLLWRGLEQRHRWRGLEQRHPGRGLEQRLPWRGLEQRRLWCSLFPCTTQQGHVRGRWAGALLH